jgi:hypothetical protein
MLWPFVAETRSAPDRIRTCDLRFRRYHATGRSSAFWSGIQGAQPGTGDSPGDSPFWKQSAAQSPNRPKRQSGGIPVVMPGKSMTIACKVSSELASGPDRTAGFRCVSRPRLVRELIEARLEGRVILPLSLPNVAPAREICASDVSWAAQERARLDVATACRGDPTAQDIDSSTLNLDQVVSRAIRPVAEGR